MNLLDPYKYSWQGETCRKCRRPNFIGYELEDDVWYEITRGFYTILCIPCLDELATRKSINWVPYLVGELYPCSTVGWSED